MIPAEPWYEMLRFIFRNDEDHEWRYAQQPRAWVYEELGPWSIPHQARLRSRVV